MYVLEQALKDQGRPFSDITVAVQGFGNVGSNAARLIADAGARIVAVGDHLRRCEPRRIERFRIVRLGAAAPHGKRFSRR